MPNLKEIAFMKKCTDLYSMLSQSEFQNEIPDTTPINILYCIQQIDLALVETKISRDKLKIGKPTIGFLAMELIRVSEVNIADEYTMYSWAKALIKMMDKDNMTLKMVNKMSNYDLRNSVIRFMEE